jgi:putative tricarboxylic transport membrane protein
MRKSGFSIVCLVIGFLLGPMLEMALRQTMLMHKTDLTILLTRPISAVFLALTVFFIWHFGFRPIFQKKKNEKISETQEGNT